VPELKPLDGISSKSNLIYWGRVLSNIENEIETSKEYEMNLDEALCYPLWLLAASEYVFSLIRRKIGIICDKGQSLDYPYGKLVKESQCLLSTVAHEYVKEFEIIRNTIIHKGFPNAFSTTMKKIKDNEEESYEEIQHSMRTPSFYLRARKMIEAIKYEIG
jgi:hypothetical protein